MIAIEKYSVDREHEVNLLSVKPQQSEFTVSNINDVISSLKEHEHPHLIINNGEVAGFFLLDLSYTETYGFNDSKALGVRSLLVDHRFQGLLRLKPLIYYLLTSPSIIQIFKFSN